ncbi:ATP-binding protein [Streptomyces sp. NPDC090135]|uniref:ATP-binding protein n=1 Tax=Streptomyces sp. NPDC090135 TaxID=3365957 RepID=UPI003801029A
MGMISVDIERDRPAGSIAAARDSARRFLAGLLPSPTPETAENVLLVVSELVTNALRHGGGACVLDLSADPNSVEVAVHDQSPHAPRMRTRDLNGGTGGFGWPMVNRIAATTAVTHRAAGGKTVSALFLR